MTEFTAAAASTAGQQGPAVEAAGIYKQFGSTQALRGVDISQQDDDGNIVTKWYADRATFNKDGSWTFIRGKQVFFDKDGNVLKEDDSWLRGQKRITGWSETIW